MWIKKENEDKERYQLDTSDVSYKWLITGLRSVCTKKNCQKQQFVGDVLRITLCKNIRFYNVLHLLSVLTTPTRKRHPIKNT